MMDLSVLENCSLFKGIKKTELEKLLSDVSCSIQSFEKDEIIFQAEEPAKIAAIVLEGRVQGFRIFHSGHQVNVSTKSAGDIIGHAPVFAIQKNYPCTVRAMEPSELMFLQRDDILNLLQRDKRILYNFLESLSTLTYSMGQRLELLSYRGIAQKAAYWLLLQSEHTDGSRVKIPESMTQLAMLLNVSRPSLHRELKSMHDSGLIDYEPPVIVIKDREALQNML